MNPTRKKRVVIGMSGGVDSSVAAYLLQKQNYDVIGVFMKNWDDENTNDCEASNDFADVVAVCNHLNIPYYSVNFAKEYWDNVFTYFLEEHRKGRTPNPDVLCNKEIKFKTFLKHAYNLGAEYVATGHYARTVKDNETVTLLRGKDDNKDQTYFLHQLTIKQLENVIFPLGNLEKKEVREIASQIKLPNATKKDSTGICFIGKRNFKQFLQTYIATQKGSMQTLAGLEVGTHDGLMFYTIGQRHGLGIGGRADSEVKEPWFVVGKNSAKNILYVEQGFAHPILYATSTTAIKVNWLNNMEQKTEFNCTVKTRYRQKDTEATVKTITKNKLEVVFKEPIRAVTPGQSIVFYKGSVCLGGATIETVYKDNSILPYI